MPTSSLSVTLVEDSCPSSSMMRDHGFYYNPSVFFPSLAKNCSLGQVQEFIRSNQVDVGVGCYKFMKDWWI